jgi:hypothetical protein
MVGANAHVTPLLGGVSDRSLLKSPVNVLRLSLREGGLAPHIANLANGGRTFSSACVAKSGRVAIRSWRSFSPSWRRSPPRADARRKATR